MTYYKELGESQIKLQKHLFRYYHAVKDYAKNWQFPLQLMNETNSVKHDAKDRVKKTAELTTVHSLISSNLWWVFFSGDAKVCYLEGFDVRDVEGHVPSDLGPYSGGGGQRQAYRWNRYGETDLMYGGVKGSRGYCWQKTPFVSKYFDCLLSYYSWDSFTDS